MNTSQTGESDGQDSWVARHARHERGRRRREHRAELGLSRARSDPARRAAARPARHRDGQRRRLRAVPGGPAADAAPPAGCGGPGLGRQRAARRPRCRRASRSPAARASVSSATTARSAPNCSVFNFNPLQLLPDAARALQRHRAREPRRQRERRGLFDVQLRQEQGCSSRSRRPACSAPAIFTPLANPLIGAQARAAMIDAAEAGRHRRARSTSPASRTRRRRIRTTSCSTTGPTQRQRRRRRRRRSANPVPPAHRRARRRAPRTTTTRCSRRRSVCAAHSRTTGITTCRSSTARRIACWSARGLHESHELRERAADDRRRHVRERRRDLRADQRVRRLRLDHARDGGVLRRHGAAAAGLRPADRPGVRDGLVRERCSCPRPRAPSRSASASSIATSARA